MHRAQYDSQTYGWRARWGGGIGGRIPCDACHHPRDTEALCAECQRCRGCAPGPWRVCREGVRGCGPYCGDCARHVAHHHPAPADGTRRGRGGQGAAL